MLELDRARKHAAGRCRGRVLAVRATVLFLASSCLAFAPGSHGTELFGPASNSIRVGNAPRFVVAGEFNADGLTDLVVLVAGSASARVLLGDGDGGFRPGADVGMSTLSSELSATVGEFNGDGAADIAVTDNTLATVSILLGDGTGGLTLTDSIRVGVYPISIAVGEFNGDGAADIATANQIGSVSILLGDGLGGFERLPDIPTGTRSSSVAIGDFDTDGNQDLAVTNRGELHDGVPDTVSILLGDGRGRFRRAADVGVGDRPSSVAVGDFDKDGRADLAVTNEQDDTVSILLGDGVGGFRPRANVAVDRPIVVVAGELNGDRAVDLVVVHLGSQPDTGRRVSILLGNDSGEFSRTGDFAVGGFPRSVAVAEFNRDGAADLAVANFSSGSVTILLGDGLGGFGDAVDVAVGHSPRSVGVGRFNGDGADDLAVANSDSDSVSILLGDGKGGFRPTAEVAVGRTPLFLAVGELNGDAKADLAVANWRGESVSILLGDGEGEFSRVDDIPVGNLPVGVAVGEFNADGASDLAVVSALGDSIRILFGDGHGGFGRERRPDIMVGDLPRSVAVGDFDGDGAADLAVALFSNTISIVRILMGDGDGRFTPRPESIDVGEYPIFVVTGEFNADGVDDLAVANADGDSVSILIGDGDGGFRRESDVAVGFRPTSIAVGEFNADATTDLAVANYYGNSTSVLLGNGRGGFRRAAEFSMGVRAESVAVGEFNGDGASDLAVAKNDGSTFSDSVALLFNQLRARADVNGSNRIDGLDVSDIARRAGQTAGSAAYRWNADVDLDGMIDGQDLAHVGSRFGELRKEASPLRATLTNPSPPAVGTVTFQELASEGDRLTVRILVNDPDDAIAGADLVATFQPVLERTLESPDPARSQVLEGIGFRPGTCPGTGLYDVAWHTPGQVTVAIVTITGGVLCDEQPLVDLIFQARREGKATLAFDPQSTLQDASGRPVAGVSLGDRATVDVISQPGGAPLQRIGVSPDVVDFGGVSIGDSSRRSLRISNFGFSTLTVIDVSSDRQEVTSFFSGEFEVVPFGFVELPVVFRPKNLGSFAGELTVTSNDPGSRDVRVPVEGHGIH